MKKNLRKPIAWLVAVLALALLAWPKIRPVHPTRAEAVREPTPVVTAIVQSRPLDESISVNGTIHAEESVDVQAETTGKLLKILFREGATVAAGELLAVINDAELRAALQRAGLHRKLAELKARRLLDLIDRGGVPQQEYDVASSELDVFRAEEEVIRAQLARTEIRAPFAGVIGLRAVSEGAQISPSTRLATLQNVASMKLDFTVPEKYAGIVTAGRQVSFTVAGSDHLYTADVYAAEPQLDEATRTRLIRARTPNPDQSLFPGAFARVSLALSRNEKAMLIPSIAITTEAGRSVVLVVEHGKVRQQVVGTGARRGEATVIIAGLKDGDEVIVTGTQLVRTGSPVKAMILR